MTLCDPAAMSTGTLLRHMSALADELRTRGISRSANNPTGDYAEWLVSKRLGFTLRGNSDEGYDAADKHGVRYQIKARRVKSPKSRCQLSAIRDLYKNQFDFLIGLVFSHDYTLVAAYRVPHATVARYAKYRAHVNAHILHLNGELLLDSSVTNITADFAEVDAHAEPASGT